MGKSSTREIDKKASSVRLNELRRPLLEMSHNKDRSVNYLVKQAVREYLAKHGYKIKDK